ncbi:MAG: hypothetical protein ABGY41_15035, partial [Candidatus Poribacteria bacterium]
RIELLRGDSLVAFTRQGVVWRISEPVVERADNAIVDGILLALDRMTVESFGDGSARAMPAPELALTLVSKNLERVTYSFWTPGEGGVEGRVTGDPDTFTITPDQYAEVSKTLEDTRVMPIPDR